MDGLKKFWENWKKFGHFIGDWVARIFLTIFYWTVFVPFGLIGRFTSDRLNQNKWSGTEFEQNTPSWIARTTNDNTIEDARGQS